MKQHTKSTCRRALALCMSVLMLLTAWVFVAPTKASAASVWNGTTVSNPGASEYVESGSTLTLKSANALVWFIYQVNRTNTTFEGITVYLDVDVDLGGHNFKDNVMTGDYSQGNAFKGTFDGRNHTISGFKFVSSYHRVAMFRTTNNATFKNVTFTNVFIDDESDSNKKNGFAVLSGYHETGSITFENVHVNSGNICGYNYVGALVGEIGANSSGNALTMTDCSNGATINALNVRIGGLAGSSLPMVDATNCTNTGNVTAGSTDVGGIVGWIEDDASSFTGCSNSGNVQGKDAVGGIVGYFGNQSQDKKLTLTNNTNTGNITATSGRAGGIAGHIETDNNAHEITGNVNSGTIIGTDDCGGIVGRNAGYGVWTDNKNYGAVNCSGDNAGGILGEVEDDKQEFHNCYNTGEITGKNTTGGIAGWLNTAADNVINNCYNTGNITSTNGYAGGIFGGGKKYSAFTECFNIGTIKGVGDTGGIMGHNDYHTYFNRCFNAGSVNSNGASNTNSRGGIIGYTSYNGHDSSARMIDDCHNWGSVSNGQYSGGLVGRVNGGNTGYKVEYSYNAGSISGSAAGQIIGSGGTIGSQIFSDSNVAGTVQGTSKTDAELIAYGFSIDSYYCKNTWGVRIGSTTYKYPVHTWYRNKFQFQSNFVDSASGTNTTITKTYGESFTVPNPTRSGYSTGQWLSGNTHRLVRGQTITAGDTYLMNTNYDTSAGPADTNTVVQSFSEPTEVKSTRTYGLIWNEGAAANMYAMAFANETSNAATDRFRTGIDYTIYNLTTGHDSYYTDAHGDSTADISSNGQYFKTFQHAGTGNATATLEVDRSLYDDIKDTGIYIDYYPFIYSASGGVNWGVEIFNPSAFDRNNVLNNDHWTATVTGKSGKSYTYEQRFSDVNGSDHRCAEAMGGDFGQEVSGSSHRQVERRYNNYDGYKWYFKGAAPAVGESVTLRIVAICVARYSSSNKQILSEWTDLTITGTCSHSQGFTAQTATDDYKVSDATCTAAATYYYSCPVCGESENDASHTFASGAALGHHFDASYGVNALNNGTHNFKCERFAACGACGVGTTADAAEACAPGTPATCTEPAVCGTCGASFGSALNHDWNEPTYDWALDGKTCTATRTCNNGDHPETETVTLGSGITAAVKTPANCSTAGTTTYTAVFQNTAFTRQSKDVQDIPTNEEHDYAFESFVWNLTVTPVTAQAKYVCTRDGGHTAYYGAAVTSSHTDASCTAGETTVYTATYDGHTDEQTVNGQPATGHTYAAPADDAWAWTKDGDGCTAAVTVTCTSNDDSQALSAVATLTASKAATHLEDGYETYSATLTAPNGQTFSSTHTFTLTAEGHHIEHHAAVASTKCDEYGTIEYWSCTGCDDLFADENAETVITDISDHTYGPHSLGAQTPAAPATDCQHTGTVAYYTCDICGAHFSDALAENPITDLDDHTAGPHGFSDLQSDDTDHWYACANEGCTEIDRKTAHTYSGAPVWGEWTDGNTVVATFKCDGCDHTITPEVTVTPDAHNATCTEAGYTVYTATVTNNGTEYENPTTKTVAGDPATGHTYAEPVTSDWTWTQDGETYIATVVVTCPNCTAGTDGHTVTLTAAVELTENVAAGHLTDGHKLFTATATIGAQTFTATKTDVVEAAGHSWTHHDAVSAADCQHTGTIEYWSCSGCDELRAADKETVITTINNNTAGPHSYGAWTQEVAATCHDTGVAGHYTCTLCQANFDAGYAPLDTLTLEINPDAHVAGEEQLVSAGTCSAKAQYKTCCRYHDDVVLSTREGDMNPDNHVNTSETEPVTANCVTEGFSAGTFCNDCRTFITGHESQGYNTGETGHDYGTWTSNGDNTHSRTCSRCDETVANHAVTGDCAGGTATCTAKAICTTCGQPYGEFDYNNHSTTETVTRNAKEPGYTYKGYTGDKYCLACDHPVSTGEEIDKLNIEDNATYSAAATISAEAQADPTKYDANDITTLNAKLDELEAALAIDDNDDAVNTILGELATIVGGISELEYVTVTFMVDGETVKTETILSGADATPPAQAELIQGEENHKRFSGWSGSYTNVTADVTVSATYETEAHTWVDGEVTLAATCVATGTQNQSCACGATNVKTLGIDADNHTGNNSTTRENEVAATCTAAGSYDEVVRCECGALISSTPKTIAKLDHTPGAPTRENEVAATCTKAATYDEVVKCSVCTTELSRTQKTEGSPLGHSWSDWSVTKNATCTEDGKKTRTCGRDGSHTETVTIPKTGHVDANGDNTCDVCGATINTSFRCSFCDEYEANRDKLFIGWIYIIVHFFIHLFAQLKAWV